MVKDRRALRQVRAEIVSRRVGEEVVLLDPRTNQTHLLRGGLAQTWECLRNGSAPALPPAVATAAEAALDELDLLTPRPGVDRRTVLAVAGLAAVALPAVESVLAPSALAAGSVGPVTVGFIADGITHTLTVPNGVTVTFTLVGGGGGGGAGWNSFNTGGAGGRGGVVTGQFTNNTGSAQTFTVIIGFGGNPAQPGIAGATFPGSGYGRGGYALQPDTFNRGKGGSGGGGTAMLLPSQAPFLVAGGGGGGGGAFTA
jgi:hypothetical protein